MKILVIDHMIWIRLCCHSWSVAGADVVPWILPTITLAHQPPLRLAAAAGFLNAVRQQQPGVIVDVDAAGILPLDDRYQQWTADLVDVPWVVWWWDDPYTVARKLARDRRYLEAWTRAIRAPRVVHAAWDETLAREYTRLFQRPVHWLPTGVHTGLFHPDAAQAAGRRFAATDISFLGGYYADRPLPDSPELSAIIAERLAHPDGSYPDIVARLGASVPTFGELLKAAVQGTRSPFDDTLLSWKEQVEIGVGRERRNRPLDALADRFASRFFVGDGWPDRFHVTLKHIAQPEDLTACYRSTLLNLALGSARTFTGSAMRCYEIMAAGAALAIQGRPDFDPAGQQPGQAYVSFDTVDELADHARRLKADAAARRALGEAAREYAVAHHSWNHRLIRLLAIAGGQI